MIAMALQPSEKARIRLVTLASLSEAPQSSSRIEMDLSIATRLLAAQDGELEAVNAYFRSLANPLHKVRAVLSTICWICVVFLAFGIWLMFNDPSTIARIVWLFPAGLILSYVFVWPRWQHTVRAKRWVEDCGSMPPSLAKIMANLRAGWGGTNATIQSTTIAVLESAIASLLCSPDERDRMLVRSKTGRICQTLTVVVDVLPDRNVDSCQSSSLEPVASTNAPLSFDEHRQQPAGEETTAQSAAVNLLSPAAEEAGQQYNRIRFAPPRAGLKSSWVMDLGVTADELLDRIAMLEPPSDCTIPVDVVKVVLGASLTTLLKPGEDGRLNQALAAGKEAVKAMGVQGYSARESDDWIRKLIAPPLPWIQQQLSTSLRQASFSLLGGGHPRLP
jgi:hypothetical protein